MEIEFFGFVINEVFIIKRLYIFWLKRIIKVIFRSVFISKLYGLLL
jgi:hypothetical protein